MTTATQPLTATSAEHMTPSNSTKPHIVVREFDAPRDLVWEVTTQAEHLAKWFSPEGRTGSVKTMEFRPGGILHYAQTNDDGSGMLWGKAVYKEIDPKDRIVFVQSFSDENGGISTHPMAPNWPKVMYCIYTFVDLGNNRTRFTVEWTPAEGSSTEEITMFDGARAGMDMGWKGTLDKLETYLAAQH